MSAETSKHLIIPVEVKVRDFLPRLLLACAAVEAGFHVIFGQDRQINQALPQLPKGLLFDKSVAANKHRRMQETVNAGFAFAAEDAETLSFYVDDPDPRIRQRISQATLDLTVRYYCWGQRQLEAVKARFEAPAEKLRVPGTIRTDILQPRFNGPIRERAQVIRNHLGPFFLFNSNLSLIHHLQGPDHIVTQARDFGVIQNERDASLFEGRRRNQEGIKAAVLALCPRLLQAFPGVKFIVRPHPVEDPRHWEEALAPFDGAGAVYEGSALEWMLASKAVLHNGCTTAVEAVALGVPALGLLEGADRRYDVEVSNKITETARHADDVLARLRALGQSTAETYRLDDDLEAAFQAHLRFRPGHFAFEEILSDLQSLDWEKDILGHATRMAADTLPAPPQTTHRIGKDLAMKKFPGMQADELVARIKSWQADGHFPALKNLRQLAPHLFHLSV